MSQCGAIGRKNCRYLSVIPFARHQGDRWSSLRKSIARLLNSRGTLTACLGLIALHAVASAPDGATLMKRCLGAWDSLRYRGIQTTTVANPGVSSSTRKAEVERDDLGRVRVTYTDSGAVVIDDGKRTYQFNPGTRVLHVGWSAPAECRDANSRWNLLKRNYKFVNTGKATVAGRKCWVIKAMPLRALKYSRTFWIDAERYAPLKIEVVNSSGSLVFRSAYTVADFGSPVSCVAFIPNFEEAKRIVDPQPKVFSDIGKLQKSAVGEFRALVFLPGGFAFSHAQLYPPTNSMAAAKEVVKLYFTDGLSNISIYQLRADDAQNRLSTRTAGNESILECTMDGLRLVMIGDVEPGLLRQFYEALKRPEAARK